MIYREARQYFSLKLKNAGIEEAETELSVSYTHLTLPTKRIV